MIYEYKCEKCSNIKELDFGMHDKRPKTVICKKCGGDSYRVFSGGVIIPEHMRYTYDSFNYEKNTQIHGKKYY